MLCQDDTLVMYVIHNMIYTTMHNDRHDVLVCNRLRYGHDRYVYSQQDCQPPYLVPYHIPGILACLHLLYKVLLLCCAVLLLCCVVIYLKHLPNVKYAFSGV